MALHQALVGFEQDPEWQACMSLAESKNRWFDADSIAQSLSQWRASTGLNMAEAWAQRYPSSELHEGRLGVIMAGNLPLVGMHDLISGVLSGYRVIAKRSSDDEELPQFWLKKAAEFDSIWNDRIEWASQLKDLQAAIATGNNQTAQHFAHFFRNIPHLIRHNRSSIAVLSGNESPAELLALGQDVFSYYGLGCRSVSKLYVPQGYSFEKLLPVWEPVYNRLALHHKYVNNYHYHKALLLMNLDPHIDAGYLVLKEREALHAPVGMLNYEFYKDIDSLRQQLIELQDEWQCVVSQLPELDMAIPFGQAQCPGLFDFADGVDTVAWLQENAPKAL